MLNNYSNNITKQSVKDACLAYQRFLNINLNFLNLRVKENLHQAFMLIIVKLISKNKVKLEKLTDSKNQTNKKLI